MKKLHTLIIFLTLFFLEQASAQVKKGSVLLGGDFSGSSQRTKAGETILNRRNGITFTPVLGKAIRDNKIVGGNISFTFYEDNNSGVPDYRQQQYGLGVFLRKYKQVGNSGFSVFLQSRLDFSYGVFESTGPASNTDETKRYGISLGANPGLSFTISKKLQLESGFNNIVNLGFYHDKRTMKGTTTSIHHTNGFNIGSSLFNPSGIYLGFRLLLGA
jgi:hypothetical protein